MKKYLLIIMLIFITKNIYALNGSYSYIPYSFTNKDGKTFLIYSIKIDNEDGYILTPNNYYYNFNFDDYYEVSFENSPFDSIIGEILKYENICKDLNINDCYPFILLLLWNYIYPNEEYEFEKSSQSFKNDYSNLLEVFNKTFIQNEFFDKTYLEYKNEDNSYYYEYLKYYETINYNNTFKKDNYLYTKNDGKDYNILFKMKSISDNRLKLYTDGKYYLLRKGDYKDLNYSFNVNIKKHIYDININNNVSNCIYKVYDKDNNFIDEFITNNFSLEEGNYIINCIYDNNLYEGISEIDINLNDNKNIDLNLKKINNELVNEEEPENEDNLNDIIDLSNNEEYMYYEPVNASIIDCSIIFIIIGYLFVKKNYN